MFKHIIKFLLISIAGCFVPSCFPGPLVPEPVGYHVYIPFKIIDSKGLPLYSYEWLNNEKFHLDYTDGTTNGTAFLTAYDDAVRQNDFKPIYLNRDNDGEIRLYLYASLKDEIVYESMLYIEDAEYQLKIRCLCNNCNYSSHQFVVTLDKHEVEIPVQITVPDK